MKKTLRKLQLGLARAYFGVASRLAPGPTGRALARRFVTPDKAGRQRASEALAQVRDMQRGELTVGDQRVATYTWGDPARQPFVLIGHGWSSFGLRFAAWVPRLRAMGYAVVSFDQPGHGLSEGAISSMPHFIHMLRIVGRHFGRPAAYIGHSLGAMSIAFAEESDWRPGRFVLLAPQATPVNGVWRAFRMLRVSPRVFPHFENWLRDLTGTKRFDDFNAEHKVPHIDRPALVIHDRLDRETPWEEGSRYASLWPGARFMTTEGLGHNRMVDHASVIDASLDFVGRAAA